MDELEIKQKSIEDFKRGAIKHYKCSKCGCYFAYPEKQHTGHICPFCSIELTESQPPKVDESSINKIEKINIVTIKSKEGKIVEIKELNDEEFSKITKGSVPKKEITGVKILIISKTSSCAITKLLVSIIKDSLQNELVKGMPIEMDTCLITDADHMKYINESDNFFPQIALISECNKCEEVEHLSIKNFNKEYLIGTLLKIK